MENEEDKECPFAFLATYATKDKMGRVLHVPLKNALIEYKGERGQLLKFLSCFNKVAEKVNLIADFMDSGEIYHPIRLTSSEAYELLKSVLVIEECGITCRVPNWWRRQYSSINMDVKIDIDKAIGIKDHVEAMLEKTDLPHSKRVMSDSYINTLFGLGDE